MPPVTPAPFLKWVGGKRRLLPELTPRIGTVTGRYHEPFAGGGAVFFALRASGALRGPVVLADANLRLVRACRALRDDAPGVVEALDAFRCLPRTREQYERVRGTRPDDGPDTEVAAWLIYVNRLGYNGLYRVNRAGDFNVPFDPTADLTHPPADLLHACARALAGVDIRHADFEAVVADARAGDTIYADPPYLGTFTAYTGAGFALGDHARLARALVDAARRGVRVLVSGSDAPEMAEAYPEEAFARTRLSVRRTVSCKAADRGDAPELLLTPVVHMHCT